jgi:hypothetical protein
MAIDETICYDIQMVTSKMINKRILQDYGFEVNENLVTKERSDRLCSVCPFNQLMQTAHVIEKTATA